MNNLSRHLKTLSLSLVLALMSTLNKEGIAFNFESPPTSAVLTFNEFPFITDDDSTTSNIEVSIDFFADENGQGALLEDGFFTLQNTTIPGIVSNLLFQVSLGDKNLFDTSSNGCISNGINCAGLFDRLISVNRNSASLFFTTNLSNEAISILTNDANDDIGFNVILFTGENSPNINITTTESNFFSLSTPPTPPSAVPEPLTILGSATAIGFGTFFKKRLGKKNHKS